MRTPGTRLGSTAAAIGLLACLPPGSNDDRREPPGTVHTDETDPPVSETDVPHTDDSDAPDPCRWDLDDPVVLGRAINAFAETSYVTGKDETGLVPHETCPATTVEPTASGSITTYQGGCTRGALRFEGTAEHTQRDDFRAESARYVAWSIVRKDGRSYTHVDGTWTRPETEPEGYTLSFLFAGTYATDELARYAPEGITTDGFRFGYESTEHVLWHVYDGEVRITCGPVVSGRMRIGKDPVEEEPDWRLGTAELLVDGREVRIDFAGFDGLGCYPADVDGQARTACVW